MKETVEEKKGEDFFFWRSGWRSGVVSVKGGVYAFMVIGCQHPIVRGLSSGSNLGTEVVAFCALAHQTIVIFSGVWGSVVFHVWPLLSSGNR